MKLIVANWKMSLDKTATQRLLHGLVKSEFNPFCEITVCPSIPYLAMADEILRGSSIKLGAQNCCNHINGAYTGETSVIALGEYNCHYCLVGHSERRTMFEETNTVVKHKATLCGEYGITPIICIGESAGEYESGLTKAVLTKQITQSIPDRAIDIVVAYEPVWAIGTGKNPTLTELADIFKFLASQLPGIKLLYGGSVSVENAKEIATIVNVDGLLIGSSSLDYEKFASICQIKY